MSHLFGLLFLIQTFSAHSTKTRRKWKQKTRWYKSPAWVFIQDLQDLLVGPTGGGLDKRYNTTSVVQVELLSHAGRGALDSGWGVWGCTAQCTPLKWGYLKEEEDNRGKRRRRKDREKNKEKILSSTNSELFIFLLKAKCKTQKARAAKKHLKKQKCTEHRKSTHRRDSLGWFEVKRWKRLKPEPVCLNFRLYWVQTSILLLSQMFPSYLLLITWIRRLPPAALRNRKGG